MRRLVIRPISISNTKLMINKKPSCP